MNGAHVLSNCRVRQLLVGLTLAMTLGAHGAGNVALATDESTATEAVSDAGALPGDCDEVIGITKKLFKTVGTTPFKVDRAYSDQILERLLSDLTFYEDTAKLRAAYAGAFYKLLKRDRCADLLRIVTEINHAKAAELETAAAAMAALDAPLDALPQATQAAISARQEVMALMLGDAAQARAALLNTLNYEIRSLRSMTDTALFDQFMNAFVEPYDTLARYYAAPTPSLGLIAVGLSKSKNYPILTGLYSKTAPADLTLGSSIIGLYDESLNVHFDFSGQQLLTPKKSLDVSAGKSIQVFPLPSSGNSTGVRLEPRAPGVESAIDVTPLVVASESAPIGSIWFASFYQDFDARTKGETDYVSATRDVTRILKENPNFAAVVIDLRYNGGGHLSEVIDMVGLFLGEVEAAQFETKRQQEKLESRKRQVTDLPVGILVNQHTGSGAEVFARTLQLKNRAKIFGEPTQGMAKVTNTLRLENYGGGGFGLMQISAGELFSAERTPVDGVGVTPDVEIDFSDPDWPRQVAAELTTQE